MKYFINKIIQFFISILLVFAINRFLFLIFNSVHLQQFTFANVLQLLYKPLPLDFSTACYLTTLPFLIGLIAQFFQFEKIAKIIFWLIFFELFLVNFLSAIDVVVYREMAVKINFKLFSHLQHPTEVIRSAGLKYWLQGTLMVLFFTFFEFYFIKKIIGKWVFKIEFSILQKSISSIFILLIGAFLLIVGIRGGLQPVPINESEVYFSKNNFFNEVAVNPSWALIHSYIENKKILEGNPYKQFSDMEAKKNVDDLFFTGCHDTTIFVLRDNKLMHPNIVIIILESWSADVIESFGGMKNIAPHFDELCKEGIVFKNCYASGTLSDQGIPAVLSAYPAQPITSIIANPEKYPKLHCITQPLKENGYYTSFYFGGQLIYGNIKSYLYYFGFDEIKEQKDFPDFPSGKLGIHDSLMLQTWLQNINHFPTPFFTSLFTVSTHSPFDAPMPEVIKEGDYLKPYLNSIHYSDKCLADFFAAAKKTNWYKNTLFVLVSDHSHDSPLNINDEHAAKHCHIPLLFCGGAISDKWKGKVITKTCSQNDIVQTILHQTSIRNINYPFHWSKNLFNPYTKDFAYYSFTEGGGFITDSSEGRWEKPLNQIIGKGNQQNENAKKAKAYLQTLMNEYLSF